jgi:hypothetical protein
MASMFGDQEIEFPCGGNYGRKFKKKVSWLERNKTLKCVCGTVNELDSKKLTQGLRDVENKLKTLGFK